MELVENNRTIDPQEWALTIFISTLPLVGFIMLLIWAFSGDTNIHKKNWAKGTLIIYVITLVIVFAFLFFFGGLAIMANLMD